MVSGAPWRICSRNARRPGQLLDENQKTCLCCTLLIMDWLGILLLPLHQIHVCNLFYTKITMKELWVWPTCAINANHIYSCAAELEGTENTFDPLLCGYETFQPHPPFWMNHFLTGWFDLTHPSDTEPNESVCDEEALWNKIAWKIDWTKPRTFKMDPSNFFITSWTISAVAL